MTEKKIKPVEYDEYTMIDNWLQWAMECPDEEGRERMMRLARQLAEIVEKRGSRHRVRHTMIDLRTGKVSEVSRK